MFVAEGVAEAEEGVDPAVDVEALLGDRQSYSLFSFLCTRLMRHPCSMGTSARSIVTAADAACIQMYILNAFMISYVNKVLTVMIPTWSQNHNIFSP